MRDRQAPQPRQERHGRVRGKHESSGFRLIGGHGYGLLIAASPTVAIHGGPAVGGGWPVVVDRSVVVGSVVGVCRSAIRRDISGSRVSFSISISLALGHEVNKEAAAERIFAKVLLRMPLNR